MPARFSRCRQLGLPRSWRVAAPRQALLVVYQPTIRVVMSSYKTAGSGGSGDQLKDLGVKHLDAAVLVDGDEVFHRRWIRLSTRGSRHGLKFLSVGNVRSKI